MASVAADALPASRLGVWVLAARPRTLSAAVAPVLVGSAMAAHDGVFSALPATAALVASVLIQVGTNFANDHDDFAKGVDTVHRHGGVRVTQAGLASPLQVRRAMLAAFAAAAAVGLYLVLVAGWPVLVIGLAAIASGILYTGGPWPFGYHGLGEAFVLAFFGLVAVAGTYYVQALTFEPATLVAGLGVGALASAILVVNNLRDIDTDRAANKRTLAVIIGAGATRIELVALLTMAALVPVAGVMAFAWPTATLAGSAAVALAWPGVRLAFSAREPSELNRALAATAMALGAYGVLVAGGFVL